MSLGPAIPALPVSDTGAAIAYYVRRLGFTVMHESGDFAVLTRDGCTLHLWLADDITWTERPDPARRPVTSGAESFLAGTASCRIPVDTATALHALFEELRSTGALHRVSRDHVSTTDYGQLEVHASDLDGNLLSFCTPVG